MTEFIEHKLNQGVEESTLFESLIAWKTRNDVDRATKATSSEDLQDSETTNEETHCELILYQCICDLRVTCLPEYYFFLENRARGKSYASCDCLAGSGGM